LSKVLYIFRRVNNKQDHPHLLVPSKMGLAREETHRSLKIETKIKVKKKGGKGRAIKNQIEKRGKAIKNWNTKKVKNDE
jgi:hypothetical protein